MTKKRIIHSMGALALVIFLQACATQGAAVSNTTLTSVQQMLTEASNQGFDVFGNAQSFSTNAMVEAALPEEMKNINAQLEKMGLGNVVALEKQYISKTAAQTVAIAKPIVTSAIQQMTLEDAVGILAGGNGAATKFLQDKTQGQLMAAIQPKVEAELNSNGATAMLNNAFKSTNLVGALTSILGGTTPSSTAPAPQSISAYASQQMVNGLFNVVAGYENNVRTNPVNALGALLGNTNK